MTVSGSQFARFKQTVWLFGLFKNSFWHIGSFLPLQNTWSALFINYKLQIDGCGSFYKPLGSNLTLSLLFPDINPRRLLLSLLGANTVPLKCWWRFFRFGLLLLTLSSIREDLSVKLTSLLWLCVCMCIRHGKSVCPSCNKVWASPSPLTVSPFACSYIRGLGLEKLVPSFEKRQKVEKVPSVQESECDAECEWGRKRRMGSFISGWAGKSKAGLRRWCLLLRSEGWWGMGGGWKVLLSAWVCADYMFVLQPTQTR